MEGTTALVYVHWNETKQVIDNFLARARSYQKRWRIPPAPSQIACLIWKNAKNGHFKVTKILISQPCQIFILLFNFSQLQIPKIQMFFQISKRVWFAPKSQVTTDHLGVGCVFPKASLFQLNLFANHTSNTNLVIQSQSDSSRIR